MSLEKFFEWWWAELLSMVPGVRRGLAGFGQIAEFDLSRSEVVVSVRSGNKVTPVGRAGLDDSAEAVSARQTLAAHLQSMRASLGACLFKLAPGLALRKEVTLPAAATENLHQVLAFEMDRLTPFRVEDVYYDYDGVSVDRVKQKLTANLTISRRGVIDECLALLGEWPVEPVPAADLLAQSDQGDAQDEQGAALLLFEPAGRTSRPRRFVVPWLIAANVGLVAALVVAPISRQRAELNVLRTEVREMRAVAGESSELRSRIEEVRNHRSYLAGVRSHSPAMVELLDELTRRIPDDTYITRLELKGGRVSLQGSSRAASALVAILEDSDLLEGVAFLSPVVRQGSEGLERFNLSATLVDTTAQLGASG